LQTRVDAAKKRGGVLGLLQRGALMTAAFGTFVRLYTLPVLRTEVTAEVRMAPAW
jgi:magnesium-protoporphyrin IX monomethyl ester (oxidative) cyclase